MTSPVQFVPSDYEVKEWESLDMGHVIMVTTTQPCDPPQIQCESGEIEVSWYFDRDTFEPKLKVVQNKVTKWQDHELELMAMAIIEGTAPKHEWRKNGVVEENVTYLGDVKTTQMFVWDPSTWNEDLSTEFRLVSGSVKTWPTGADAALGNWQDGFSSKDRTQNESFTPIILNRISLYCQTNGNGCLDYHTDKNDGKSEECMDCTQAPCVWKRNKDYIVQDNINIHKHKGDSSNKQKRYFAYRQCAFIINEGPGGPRIKLPECCVKGIREAWPEKSDGDYVGHRDN